MTALNICDLSGRHVLVVEDEYAIAYDLASSLRKVGAKIVGPVATIEKALASLCGENVDLAILDLNLGGKMSFPVADALKARRIYFVFATGYDQLAIPPKYADVPCLIKPLGLTAIMDALGNRI